MIINSTIVRIENSFFFLKKNNDDVKLDIYQNREK